MAAPDLKRARKETAVVPSKEDLEKKALTPEGNYYSELKNRILISGYIPDAVVRFGIRQLLQGRRDEYYKKSLSERNKYKLDFVRELKRLPIALIPTTANEQHYEVPTEFYKLCLGKHLKYSSCYFEPGVRSLDKAEAKMLDIYCERLQLKPGMDLLDLGCGWGSFSLYCAAKYPDINITSLSNSRTQKLFIDGEAKARGLKNLTVVTNDINKWATAKRFDRIISIEMFEHMKNYEILMAKVASFLKPKIGKVFIHIFTHRDYPYHFKGGWMAKYFFSGGTMPSHDLLLYFQKDLKIEDQWFVNGSHYGKTSECWLHNMDVHKHRIMEIFRKCYGKDKGYRWWIMWRVFYMACAETFAFNRGEEWGVSHYLFNNA